MTAAALVLLLVTCAAAAIDVRTHRIPNALTGFTALAALALALFAGPFAVLTCILAMAAAFAAGSIAFSAGWFGGGDVKLIAACCGLAGFPGAVSLVLFILIAGAVLALVTAASRRRHQREHGAPTAQVPLPYAVAIAGGSIAFVATVLVRP